MDERHHIVARQVSICIENRHDDVSILAGTASIGVLSVTANTVQPSLGNCDSIAYNKNLNKDYLNDNFNSYSVSEENNLNICDCDNTINEMKDNITNTVEVIQKSFPIVPFSNTFCIWEELSKLLMHKEGRWKKLAGHLKMEFNEIQEIVCNKIYKTNEEAFLHTYLDQNNSCLKDFILVIIENKMWDIFNLIFNNFCVLREIFGRSCTSSAHEDKIQAQNNHQEAVLSIKDDSSSAEKIRTSNMPIILFKDTNSLWEDISKYLIRDKWKRVALELGYESHDILYIDDIKNYKTSAEAFLYNYSKRNGNCLKNFILTIIEKKMWDIFEILFDNIFEIREIFGHKCSNCNHSDKIQLHIPYIFKYAYTQDVPFININRKPILIIWQETTLFDFSYIDVLKQVLYECGFPVYVFMNDLSETLLEDYIKKSQTVLLMWSTCLKRIFHLSNLDNFPFFGRLFPRLAIFNKMKQLFTDNEDKLLSLYFTNNDSDMHQQLFPQSRKINFTNIDSFKTTILQIMNND